MSNNIKILYWLYRGRKVTNGEVPLMLRVTYNKQRVQIRTGITLPASKWDSRKYKAKGHDSKATEVNNYIQKSTERLTSIFHSMLSRGDIYLPALLDRYLGKDTCKVTLLELVQHHNEQVKAKLGGDYEVSTWRKYEVLRNKLVRFIQHTYKQKDVRLQDLHKKFISDFDFYLKTVDLNAQNTTAKHCKNLKRIINVGINNGWIEKNPFLQFRTPYKTVDKIYLSEEELQLLNNRAFKIYRLELIKDLFLFQCYTGLAFTDMFNLSGKDISIGIDGKRWIIIYRKKSHIRSSIPLLPQAIQVVEKYNPFYKEEVDKPLLPVYSNQKYNSYLQEIADICGINKNLTSHVGRRTFATTVALANGVSIETVSKILGHTSIKMTQEYAMVTDLKISEEMKKLICKIS